MLGQYLSKIIYFLRNKKVTQRSFSGLTQVPFRAYYWYHSRSLRDRILYSILTAISNSLSCFIIQQTRALILNSIFPSKFPFILCLAPGCPVPYFPSVLFAVVCGAWQSMDSPLTWWYCGDRGSSVDQGLIQNGQWSKPHNQPWACNHHPIPA